MKTMDRSQVVGGSLLPMLALAGVGCGPPGAPMLDAGNDDETGGDSFGSASGSSSGPTDPDTGDDDGDGLPPQLLSASTDKSGAFIVLRFSEPMADPAGVDPADFRISFAMTSTYYPYYSSEVYELSAYVDPNQYFSYSPAFDAIAISPGGQPTDLFIKFDAPLDPIVCTNAAIVAQDYEQLSQSPEYEARAALYPHYSPGGAPVLSAQGEALAAIGPEWVEMPLGEYGYVYEYGFPNLSPQIPLNCIVEP